MRIVTVSKITNNSVFGMKLIKIAQPKVFRNVVKQLKITVIQHHVIGMKKLKSVNHYHVIGFLLRNCVNFILITIKVKLHPVYGMEQVA